MNEMLNAYRQNTVANAEYTDPHQLIAMLYDGAIEFLVRAIGHLEREEIQAKGELIGRVVAILDSLNASLDHKVGDGSLSGNLSALYDYMQRRLTEANLKNDVSMLREVHDLLAPLRDGWNGIPPEQRSREAARASAPA